MAQNSKIIILCWKLHDDNGGYALNGYSAHKDLDAARAYVLAQRSAQASSPKGTLISKPNGPIIQGGYYYLPLDCTTQIFLKRLNDIVARAGDNKVVRITPDKTDIHDRLAMILSRLPQYDWKVEGGKHQKRFTALRF